MARTPRLYEVVATYRNGETAKRHYQTPEAAEARRERFAQGRPAMLNAAELAAHREAGTTPELDVPVVTVTPSYPIGYPDASGDLVKLGTPDTTMRRAPWLDLCDYAGIRSETVRSVSIVGDNLVFTYQPNPKEAPLEWVAEMTGDRP
jgi:hypothetical protein